MHTPTSRLPARQRAQLSATGVSITRGATQVLHEAEVIVTATSRVAIVGENGRGKSTLLHVLAGTLEPDVGSVQRVGTLAIADQAMPTTDDRTVGEAVAEAVAQPLAAIAAVDAAAEGLTANTDGATEAYMEALEHAEALEAWDAERRVQIALEALEAETDHSRKLAELSVGQRYRVRLACLLGAEDDFLLLDEPTNHLDRSGLEFLSSQLRSRRGGVVLISHDRALLAEVAETMIDLDPTPDGRPRIYGGGYQDYREGRVALRQRWEHEYEREQAERARLEQNLSTAQDRLISGWRPGKGTPKHGRATRAGGLVQSVHRRQEALEAHAVSVPEPPQVFQFPQLPGRRDAVLISGEKLTVAGRLAGSVSFELPRRGRLVVTGPNGAGKSTLLQVAGGTLAPDTGSVSTPEDLRIGFLQQETALRPDQYASQAYETRIGSLIAAGSLREKDAIGLPELGLLRSEEASKYVGELSMGQQRRLDLALVLAARPHVLLLDEPTNHVSSPLVDELTEALHATEAAVMVSTHDRQLLRDTGDWPQLELPQAGLSSAVQVLGQPGAGAPAGCGGRS